MGNESRIRFSLGLILLTLFSPDAHPQSSTKVVYPQAVVGPSGGLSYLIEVKLANRSADKDWTGVLRLLRQQDLGPMTNVRFVEGVKDPVMELGGQHAVSIASNSSVSFKITSDAFQVGVMVVESSAGVSNLVASFYYRIRDEASGKFVDLIAIQPASEAGLAFTTVISQADNLASGVALVSQKALAGGQDANSPTNIVLAAVLENGLIVSGQTSLGGTEAPQKAFFPYQVINGLPQSFNVARLIVSASDPVYCGVLGVGVPPGFRDMQIGSVPALTESTRNVPLKLLGALRGLDIGAAARPGYYGETDYARTLAREYNLQTPENDMKFGPIHPARTQYNFSNADAVVNFASANGQKVHGHTLIWHSQLASWVSNATWTRDDLLSVMRDHIFTVVGRYKGQIAYWDVVNEAVADTSGNPLRADSPWMKYIGSDYIEKAFRWANEADPTAKLLYNDFNTEGLGGKSDAVYHLVRDLVQNGVPIHGVGIQCHFDGRYSLAVNDIAANMSRLAALGLEVHITELDVRMQTPVTPDKLDQQAKIYREIFQVCLSQPNCKSIVTWGFTDKYSWVPTTFSGFGSALLFDEFYKPKPAYNVISDLLAGVPSFRGNE